MRGGRLPCVCGWPTTWATVRGVFSSSITSTSIICRTSWSCRIRGWAGRAGAVALLRRFTDYLPDLAQTKIAAVHPLQRTAGMDLGWVKQHYGRRFCIIGNVDSSRTLPFGTPEQVEAETREAIDTAAPGGGYVLASDHFAARRHSRREYPRVVPDPAATTAATFTGASQVEKELQWPSSN